MASYLTRNAQKGPNLIKGAYNGADVVVLCSGGMDSIALVEHYRQIRKRIFALSIDYGQRNIKELDAARRYCIRREITWGAIDLGDLSHLLPGNALTDPRFAVKPGSGQFKDMMPVYVPNRNAIFLTIAVGVAVAQYAKEVAIGLCNSGEHHYPDTTPQFLWQFQDMQNEALSGVYQVEIQAPFLAFTKKRIASLLHATHVLPDETWSCYENGEAHCGACPACTKRKRGFNLAGVPDPTEYHYPEDIDDQDQSSRYSGEES